MSVKGGHIRTKPGTGPIVILAIVVVLLFSRDALKQISRSQSETSFRKEQLERELEAHVLRMNSSELDTVVPNVRIVGASRLGTNQLLYFCEYGSIVDDGLDRGRLTAVFGALYQSDPAMAWFRDNQIGLVLKLKDTNGVELFDITLPTTLGTFSPKARKR